MSAPPPLPARNGTGSHSRRDSSTTAAPGTPANRDSTGSRGSPSRELLRFATGIRRLFTEQDRKAMIMYPPYFDLWSYEDVVANAGIIVESVRNGSMPCTTRWPEDKVATLQRWIDAGTPE